MFTFLLPDPGEGLVEAEIVGWLVAVGDEIEVNQPILEVETAKSVVELPAPVSGRVASITGAPGDMVAVGSPVMTVVTAEDAEDAQEVASDAPQSAAEAAPADAVQPDEATASTPDTGSDGSGALLVGYGTSAAATTRRPRKSALVTPEEGRESVNVAYGTHEPVSRPVDEVRPSGRVEKDAAPQALPSPGEPVSPATEAPTLRAKPQVRRLARDLGVDLASVTGTGPDGTVTATDVALSATGGVRAGAVERIPVRGIAREMVASMTATSAVPHATMWMDVDMTAVFDLVARLKADRAYTDVRVSPLLVVARAACMALRRHPRVNASFDAEAGEIVQGSDINLGIAAATPRGLVVPVIKRAQDASLAELATELGRLVKSARDGRLSPSDLAGGTFTITNVGVFGIEGGTPLLVPGQSAILCLGTATRRPWVVGKGADEHLEVRSVAQLSLTIDHRVLDGEAGATFLADVATLLTDPGMALVW